MTGDWRLEIGNSVLCTLSGLGAVEGGTDFWGEWGFCLGIEPRNGRVARLEVGFADEDFAQAAKLIDKVGAVAEFVTGDDSGVAALAPLLELDHGCAEGFGGKVSGVEPDEKDIGALGGELPKLGANGIGETVCDGRALLFLPEARNFEHKGRAGGVADGEIGTARVTDGGCLVLDSEGAVLKKEVCGLEFETEIEDA
jgi:hypothetical protein